MQTEIPLETLNICKYKYFRVDGTIRTGGIVFICTVIFESLGINKMLKWNGRKHHGCRRCVRSVKEESTVVVYDAYQV